MAVLVNGALIALGAAAVVDSIVVHGILRWHTAAPGPWADEVEAALLVLGTLMVAAGVLREYRARAG